MNKKLFDTKKVLELHNSGMLAKDIAEQIGCSYNEHLLIQKYFKERWNIEVTIQKDGEQFMIYFPKKSKEKFAKLIKPYVIESMSYKIKNWIP